MGAYLAKRGLTEANIDEWQIGYSPDSWDDLIKFLQAKGFRDNEIFLAGMSVKTRGCAFFVGAIGFVPAGDLDRIARIAQLKKMNPLHHAPGVDVQTGNDPLGQHRFRRSTDT